MTTIIGSNIGKRIDNLKNLPDVVARGLVSTLSTNLFNKARKDKIKLLQEKYPLAQYSAILDSRVCDYCKLLDGKIISTSDYRFLDGLFDPQQHLHCRCMWIYISKFEVIVYNIKPNWDIEPEDIDKYLDLIHLKKLRRGYI